jgi:hypothetical protein
LKDKIKGINDKKEKVCYRQEVPYDARVGENRLPWVWRINNYERSKAVLIQNGRQHGKQQWSLC